MEAYFLPFISTKIAKLKISLERGAPLNEKIIFEVRYQLDNPQKAHQQLMRLLKYFAQVTAFTKISKNIDLRTDPFDKSGQNEQEIGIKILMQCKEIDGKYEVKLEKIEFQPIQKYVQDQLSQDFKRQKNYILNIERKDKINKLIQAQRKQKITCFFADINQLIHKAFNSILNQQQLERLDIRVVQKKLEKSHIKTWNTLVIYGLHSTINKQKNAFLEPRKQESKESYQKFLFANIYMCYLTKQQRDQCFSRYFESLNDKHLSQVSSYWESNCNSQRIIKTYVSTFSQSILKQVKDYFNEMFELDRQLLQDIVQISKKRKLTFGQEQDIYDLWNEFKRNTWIGRFQQFLKKLGKILRQNIQSNKKKQTQITPHEKYFHILELVHHILKNCERYTINCKQFKKYLISIMKHAKEKIIDIDNHKLKKGSQHDKKMILLLVNIYLKVKLWEQIIQNKNEIWELIYSILIQFKNKTEIIERYQPQKSKFDSRPQIIAFEYLRNGQNQSDKLTIISESLSRNYNEQKSAACLDHLNYYIEIVVYLQKKRQGKLQQQGYVPLTYS